MKKSLLCAALIAGFAGAATAETSVMLYGRVDGGVGYQQFKGTDPSTGESFKGTNTGMANGIMGGNRWGLKGSEDLGDGLTAVFVLENGFNLNSGTQGSSGRMFDRQATVGLKSSAWGQLDFGRQTSVSSKYLSGIASPFGADWGQASVGSAFSAINSVRYDNMVLYQTPSFSGLQFGIGYSFNASGNQEFKTSGGDEPNTRAWTTALRYANGPVELGLSYDQFTSPEETPAVAGVSDVSVKSWNLAGAFDFEVVKVHAGLGQTRDGWFKTVSALRAYGPGIDAPRDGNDTWANEGFKVNSYTLGLSAPVGANGKILASWVLADAKNAGTRAGWAGRDLEKQQTYSLGYTYKLSKRTNLYALGSYARHVNFADDLKATQFAVGLRHQF